MQTDGARARVYLELLSDAMGDGDRPGELDEGVSVSRQQFEACLAMAQKR